MVTVILTIFLRRTSCTLHFVIYSPVLSALGAYLNWWSQLTLYRFKTRKVEHWIARCSICFMFLGKEFCLQISKRGLGPCPKHMSFLAAFPKMLFELEHHKEEERRFVRLLMQFFCLVRLGAICNLLQTTVESVGWGQRHSHPPCECTWVLCILDEYVLCKSIPYEFIWFFHVRIQK